MEPEFGISWEHLYQGSDSTPWESSSECPSLEEQPITSLVPFPKTSVCWKGTFLNYKHSENMTKLPLLSQENSDFLDKHVQQFGLLMRQHSTGTQNLSFSWWDLLLYFSSNDLYNGKLRERTKSCSFLSQRSTEITIRANEVTQHFSSLSRKPTKSSSLNQLFNISAAHRYYGY